jgi:Astacin (Peptidase family M12A)
MKIQPRIHVIAILTVSSVIGSVNAQVMRDGEWQGGDAQKGNPHELEHDVLHRTPASCTATLGPQGRGVFNDASWPDNVIPFVFSSNVSASEAVAMAAAMGELTRVADIKFIQRTTETDYLFIQDSDENSSQVGRVGGAQTINIYNWNFEFIMVHELMHAIGVWHEQSAVDRDQFVTIWTQNIDPEYLHNFNIQTNANTTPFYDYESVMHYGTFDFSISPGFLPTITTTDPSAQSVIGQREYISGQDEVGLEMMVGDTHPTQWLLVGSPGLQFGIFELPWGSVGQAVNSAASGDRIFTIAPGTDNASASPGSPLVIDEFVIFEGATLTIQ